MVTIIVFNCCSSPKLNTYKRAIIKILNGKHTVQTRKAPQAIKKKDIYFVIQIDEFRTIFLFRINLDIIVLIYVLHHLSYAD